MEIPREVYDIWLAVALKFADLHKGSDDDRRLATRRGLATIRRRLSSLDRRRWVCKSEHNTGWDAQSKDAIGYVIDDGTINTGDARRMFMFDMMNGTTRTTNAFPIVAKNVEEGNPDAFVLIPVEEDDRDWLEDDQPPPPPPPPPGDLPVRVTKLEADLTFVRESLALLLEERVKDKQKLADLEDKITRLPVAEVKKGDPITVKGKLNLRDVLSGGEIISRGTI